uniref:Mediator of RNA polymerase II transcription subunit 23 n=1 Tax=Megaselia scalaris TaxID=36166 RepID=T1GKT0_MEGSC
MLELMVAHTKYIQFGIKKLLENWIPNDKDVASWPNCIPTPELQMKLFHVHRLLDTLLNINPLIFDVVLENVKQLFPYYKKAPHVVGGYLHNVLWLLEYQPKLNPYIIEVVFHNNIKDYKLL